MSFEEMIARFQMEIHKEFGLKDAIVKIALEPKAFDQVVQKHFYEGADRYSFRMTDVGEFVIRGVQVLARKRDSF